MLPAASIVAHRLAHDPVGTTKSLARRVAYAPWRPRHEEVRLGAYRGARFAVPANEYLGWRLLTRGDVDARELEALQRLVRPDDVCLDIGACFGLYAVLLATWAPRGGVLALEPLPRYRPLLERNIGLNDLTNVQVHPAAAGERDGRATLHETRDGVYSALRPTDAHSVVARHKVPAVTLDTLLGPRASVGIAKVDVEGAELQVLRGASNLLQDPQRRPRALQVELATRGLAAHGTSPGEVIAFLSSFGYRVHAFAGRGLRPGWPPSRASDNALFLAP